LKLRSHILLILVFLAINFNNLYPSDTLFVDKITSEINIYKYLSQFEDPSCNLSIDSLLAHPYKYKLKGIKSDSKLNFGYSTSTYWIKLVIKNITDTPADYVLEVSNPDLDHVGFFELMNGMLIKRVETGELHDVKTREIYDRNFLSIIKLEPGNTYVYYISANNGGHPFFIPISFKEKSHFERTQKKTELVFWLINGLLLFIILFNIYLYQTTKDKVNLYYSLYVSFAALTLLSYDGYFYFFNPPVIIEKIKWLNPSLYIVFLLSFTQAFTSYTKSFKWQRKILNPFKVLAIVFVLFYSLQFPYSLVADFGIPLLILASLILIIAISAGALKRNYVPSVLLLLAYCAVFLGYSINQLKELNILSSNFFVENSSKFGQTLECILLAVAVLERFRINQRNDKQTIHDNLLKIALQNKELEIINTELEKLSIVASETDNSIAIYDDNGRMEWGNTGFEKLYEVNINDLMKNARDNIELIIPNENIRHYVNKCMESQLPVVFETPVVTKSKKVLWVQTTLSPFIRSEKIFKIIAIDSDITSLKTYEKELETAKEKAVESDRLKTAFLSNMSHEIRTPLNGIMGFSQLLNGSGITPEELQNYLEIIRTCGEQLMHIIDDILEISLIESNQLKIFPVEFELKSFVREIIEFFETYKTTIGKAHIELVNEIEIEDSQFVITSDPFRLKQVLINLLKNGFKFTKEGQIKIGIYPKAQFLYFYVQDTGISIDPEKKDIIFERFRQGEETMSRKYGGSGLGLSISKGIIEKLGGNIWLDTTYKNGFKIYFTIPLVVSRTEIIPKKKNRPLHPVEGKIKGKRILIVEDHDISFKYLKEILLPFGPKLTWAMNGREAVDLVMKNQYDLILMDINLPEMDGVAATREIRKIRPDLPIIVQTAHAIESELQRIKTSGCNDLISKPINKKEFFEILSRNL
jgi:signal transduction histidine kinase/CheY-like chemotaxis protein